MTEKEMWGKMKRKITLGHWTRIENAVTSGAPDVYVCVAFKDFWVELKVFHRLIKFRPSQLAWMSLRAREDRDTVILTADDTTWRIYSFMECLNSGAFSMHLNQPHLNTDVLPPILMSNNVGEVLEFICLKLR